MTITDNELGMLEQLCYINKDLIKEATGRSYSPQDLAELITNQKDKTVGEILDQLGLNEKAIQKLERMGSKQIDGACASGKEWAEILRYLRNSDLSNLVMRDTMKSEDEKTTLALCFTDAEDPNSAIVAFKGTSGGEEWSDNIEGLNAADTDCQKEALEYIESLPYGDITVTGHSKGGNKAMYVAIKSDKVTKCVSYDGQGFSQEFLNKYWAEIDQRGGKITNYSLATDYVHALLFPVPNSNQIYCQGYGVDNAAQHHSPNSFFVTDENGNLVLDAEGKPLIIQVEEDESIRMLHEFTTFILNNAEDEEKEQLIGYLAPLIAQVFSGKKLDMDAMIDQILKDKDSLAMIIAYLVKYMDEYGLDAEDIDGLLDMLGLNALNEMITLTDFDVGDYHIDVNLNLANIINMIKNQLNDGNDDNILRYLLQGLKMLLANEYDIDVAAFWKKINNKVEKIDTSGGVGDKKSRSAQTRDFSMRVYDTLIGSINRIERMKFDSVESWKSYSDERWYSQLLVGLVRKGLCTYFERLTETNQDSKQRIERVFEDVQTLDDMYSAAIGLRVTKLRAKRAEICALSEGLK